MKTILIVEDDESVIADYLEALEGLGNLVVARSHKEAHRAVRGKELGDTSSAIDIVVLDGIVPFWADGRSLRKTDDLAEYFIHNVEEIFIIAASSDAEICKELVAKGCQFSVKRKNVFEIRKIIKTLFTQHAIRRVFFSFEK